MPKIKSPINQKEKDYNKRYDPSYQKLWLNLIDESKLDKYAKDFILNCKFSEAAGNLILNEKQADFLAELYDRYSN